MSHLLDLIIANKNLVYFDINQNRSLNICDFNLNDNFFQTSEKRLAFIYPDNSLNSIEILWSLFKSKHAIALLSPQTNIEFKKQLEAIYNPYYIWDSTRNEITYFSKNELNHLAIFVNNHKIIKNIHPELKLMLSTSGTTGSPKFVKLSEENILQNAISICDYLPIENTDVTPLNLPIFYSYGFSILTTNSIRGGKIICGGKDVLSKEFWKDFEKYKFTSLAGVPYLYEVLNRIGFTKKQYPSLRYLTQAGGKLNIKLVDLFADYSMQNNLLFYVMYGQTEATARITYLDPQYLKTKLSSIGKPILNGTFSIDQETGELIYSGPNVFGGYATTISDLSEFDQSQILRTGDIGKTDEDGFYYITGRLKRFVKLFGQRINLDEIENLLKTSFAGKTFACIGLNDKQLIVITNETLIQKESIFDFLNKNIGIHPSFVKFVYSENIPLTLNGKIDYTAITEIYATD